MLIKVTVLKTAPFVNMHCISCDNDVLQSCVHQPVQSGYRNKCEFTVGLSASTKKPVVGFRLGSYEEGELAVVSAQSCVHVPQKMKEIAMVTISYCYGNNFLLLR